MPSSALYEPAAQLVHAADVVAPSALLKLPAAQAPAHTLAPVMPLNLPRTHSVHRADVTTPVMSEYVPAAQLAHAAEEVAATSVENLPAAHEVHAELP